jgi:hypothetical protein
MGCILQRDNFSDTPKSVSENHANKEQKLRIILGQGVILRLNRGNEQ